MAPTNDEAKKHKQNLPGMGGIYNTVNFHLYHYAGNNPVKYTDPTGRSSIGERFNIRKSYTPFQQKIESILKDISESNFGKTAEGVAIVKTLRELNDSGRIAVKDLNKGKGPYDARAKGMWRSDLDFIFLDKDVISDPSNITLPGILIHEGTHRNDAKKKGLPYTLSSEKRAFSNQYVYEKETNPELANMPSDDELRKQYPNIEDDLNK